MSLPLESLRDPLELGPAITIALGAVPAGVLRRVHAVGAEHRPGTPLGTAAPRRPADLNQAALLAREHERSIDWDYVEDQAQRERVQDMLPELWRRMHPGRKLLERPTRPSV